MEITSISIKKTHNNKRQLADVSIIFDSNLLITNIKLIDNGKRRFVEFSSSMRKNYNYPDVVPLNPEMRQYIEREVLAQYRRMEEASRK